MQRRDLPRSLRRQAGYIGIGALTPSIFRRRFNPASLFATGAPGVWFDRQDLSSMYQDAAGTTACAVGSPVGLALDKSKGAVRGAELWVDASVTFGANSSRVSPGVYRINSPTGTETADILMPGITSGQWYEVVFTVDSVTAAGGGIRVAGNNVIIGATVGPKRCIALCDTNSLGFKRVSGTTDVQISGVSFKAIPGNHATQATAASRPILRQDASGRYYLEYDGVDDGMATAAIDFTGTNKLTQVAGLMKASDAAFSVFCELSATADVNSGSFYIAAPLGAAGNNVAAAMKGAGTIQGITSGAIHAAPASVVVTHQADLAAPLQVLRTNGVQRQTNATSAGAGPFGNYQLFLGRRNGTTSPFTGRDYGLILVGRTLSATEIAGAERFLASRMGIAI